MIDSCILIPEFWFCKGSRPTHELYFTDLDFTEEDFTEMSFPYANRRNVSQFVSDLRPFDGSNLKGREGSVYEMGRMPSEWRDFYRAQDREGLIDYTVISYATPIAWHTTDGNWYAPDVRYSMTTTKQMGAIGIRPRAITDIPGHDSKCGECGRTWNSTVTPTPAARCPFEYDH